RSWSSRAGLQEGVVAVQGGLGAVVAGQGTCGNDGGHGPLGDLADLDGHDFRVDGTNRQGGPDAGEQRVTRDAPMQEEHLDQSSGASGVSEFLSGCGPELVVGGGESPAGPCSGQGGGPGKRPRL